MLFHIHKKTVDLFSSRSSVTVISISLILLAMLGWVDYLTGDYSLIVFYLIPVSLVAWFVSKTGGMLFCILALATRFAVNEAPASFTFRPKPLPVGPRPGSFRSRARSAATVAIQPRRSGSWPSPSRWSTGRYRGKSRDCNRHRSVTGP